MTTTLNHTVKVVVVSLSAGLTIMRGRAIMSVLVIDLSDNLGGTVITF